ncbi:DNA-directed RNA polymerase subunit delta [Hydrogenibacillus schlegelii]|nr:DNA-directed RNA polymerase subunit delta [Hydrogenibacillus schlegelii]
MTGGRVEAEDVRETAMIDLAHRLLLEHGSALNFRELFRRIAELKGFPPEEHDRWLVQFYTDLNTDGRFVSLSDGEWGLKAWYPTEQYEDGAQYLALIGDELDEELDVLGEEEEGLGLEEEEERLDLDDEELLDDEGLDEALDDLDPLEDEPLGGDELLAEDEENH